jgi:hypothetical protein
LWHRAYRMKKACLASEEAKKAKEAKKANEAKKADNVNKADNAHKANNANKAVNVDVENEGAACESVQGEAQDVTTYRTM